MIDWLGAFFFTQAVEVPIYASTLARGAPRRSLASRLAIALGASALTHPFVWFAFPLLDLEWGVTVAWAEAFAVLVEALYLAAFGLSRRRALGVALLANAASLSLGLASRAVFRWP